MVSRAGGVVVALAGAYVAYYGWYERRLRRGGEPADPLVEAAGAVQRRLADGVDRLGVVPLAVVFALALAAAALLGWRSRRARRAGSGRP